MPSGAEPKLVVLRKLGPFERYNAALMGMHLNDNTMVTCHYTIPPDLADPQHHETLSQVWEAAVAKVVLAHPLLQAGVRKFESKKPSYIRVDAIDLSKHIKWRMIDPKAEDYAVVRKEIYTEEFCTKYLDIETQPGWRMVILRGLEPNDMEVMFGFHHTFFDGMSAKIFHEDLVKALNSNPDPEGKLVQNHTFKTTATPSATPPPQDAAVPFKNTPLNIASTLFYELSPQKVLTTLSATSRNFAQKYKGWPAITPLDPKTMRPVTAPIKTHYATFSLEKDVLSKVLANCRAKKITLTALLQVCVLIALVKEVDGSQTGSILRGGTIIDLRRYIPPQTKGDKSNPLRQPSRMMANMVTRMGHTFGQAEDEADLLERIRNLNSSDDLNADWTELSKIIWALSKRVRSEIQERLDLGAKNDTAGLMGFVPDWRQYLKDTIAKPRFCSWTVSNIGVLEGGGGSESESGAGNGEEKKWSIRKAYFAASAEITNGALAVTSVTVRGGDLSVDFTWEVGLIEDRVGEGLAHGVERLLRQVAREE